MCCLLISLNASVLSGGSGWSTLSVPFISAFSALLSPLVHRLTAANSPRFSDVSPQRTLFLTRIILAKMGDLSILRSGDQKVHKIPPKDGVPFNEQEGILVSQGSFLDPLTCCLLVHNEQRFLWRAQSYSPSKTQQYEQGDENNPSSAHCFASISSEIPLPLCCPFTNLA